MVSANMRSSNRIELLRIQASHHHLEAIFKFYLLQTDLQRRTPEEYQDHTQLEQSKAALKQVLSHINEDKRKMEGKMKIFDLVYEVNNI